MPRRGLRYGALLVALLLPLVATAQQAVDLRTQFDLVYARLLKSPADRALNRQLIDLAVALMDYDAAIGGVERLLFFDPNNPLLRLEAATYYYQTGSFAAARGYLEEALAAPSLTLDVRAEINTLLAEVVRRTRPRAWSGLAEAGARYQSNANLGTTLPGLSENVPPERPQPDWNTYALGTLGWNHALHDRAALQLSLSGYYADQFDVDRLDLGFGETVFGPRLISASGRHSLKPYAVAQAIFLGDNFYQRALGGGAVARWTLAEDRWLEAQFEYKNRLYYDSADYATATTQNGNLWTYTVRANLRVSGRWTSLFRFVFNQNDAVTDYNSYDQYSVSLGGRMEFSALGRDNWLIAPFFNASLTQYKGVAPPEAAVPLDTVREDRRWSAGVNVEIPLRWENSWLNTQFQHTENDSNLDRNTFKNTQVTFGPQVRF
jgi:hypothetical protein